MANIQEFFKKDIAGIPVWGWSLIVIGGIGIGYFVLRGKNPLANIASLGTNSTGDATSSEAAGTLAGQSGNGTVPQTFNNPDTGFTQTSVNGEGVPVLPPGYSPIFGPDGNIVGYGPTPPTQPTTVTTTPTNPTQSPTNTGTVKGSALFASRPGGTNNGGKNIGNIPGGTKLSLGQSTTFNGKTYYQTTYNGQTGYVNAASITLGTGGGSDRMYESNIFGAY